MIIAIDGPAASGKGTIARALAAHFGLKHLDTGLIYRAVGKALLDEGADFSDTAKAVDVATRVDLASLDRKTLSAHLIGEAASKVAVIPAVRTAVLDAQRRFAETPPGAVLDGRDIGTVVCPNADAKLFVDADIQIRAKRRTAEMQARGIAIEEETVRTDLERRDARDAARTDAPMVRATDAHLLDTTDKDIDAAIAQAVDYVSRVVHR